MFTQAQCGGWGNKFTQVLTSTIHDLGEWGLKKKIGWMNKINGKITKIIDTKSLHFFAKSTALENKIKWKFI